MDSFKKKKEKKMTERCWWLSFNIKPREAVPSRHRVPARHSPNSVSANKLNLSTLGLVLLFTKYKK